MSGARLQGSLANVHLERSEGEAARPVWDCTQQRPAWHLADSLGLSVAGSGERTDSKQSQEDPKEHTGRNCPGASWKWMSQRNRRKRTRAIVPGRKPHSFSAMFPQGRDCLPGEGDIS